MQTLDNMSAQEIKAAKDKLLKMMSERPRAFEKLKNM